MIAPSPIVSRQGRVFEDTIDGYFPLLVSLSQMMERNCFEAALISLTQAPMAQFPGLADTAPVPLNIRAGRAGLIERLTAWIWRSGTAFGLSARGSWRWFDGTGDDARLDPMTRLAEPAFLHGIGCVADATDTPHTRELADMRLTAGDTPARAIQPGWSSARLWGPVPEEEGIVRATGMADDFFGKPVRQLGPASVLPARYLLDRDATSRA